MRAEPPIAACRALNVPSIVIVDELFAPERNCSPVVVASVIVPLSTVNESDPNCRRRPGRSPLGRRTESGTRLLLGVKTLNPVEMTGPEPGITVRLVVPQPVFVSDPPSVTETCR